MERFLTADEVSAFLQVPKATLYAWRYQSKGPPALRIGRYLRYRPADVQTWLLERGAASGSKGGTRRGNSTDPSRPLLEA